MAYPLPSPADLRARYPAFSDTTAIPDATIQYWLDYVVGENVDQSWSDPAGARAQMAAAAHRMAEAGVLASASSDDDMTGVSSFKSGTFQVQFADAYVAQQAAGGWESTRYGRDYLDLLRANKGGPGFTSAGSIPCGYGFVDLLSPHRGLC